MSRVRLLPFDPRLQTHKLSGQLHHRWAFSINFKYRVVFYFERNDLVLLEDISALIGLTIAFASVGASALFNNGIFDAIGSIVIGRLGPGGSAACCRISRNRSAVSATSFLRLRCASAIARISDTNPGRP